MHAAVAGYRFVAVNYIYICSIGRCCAEFQRTDPSDLTRLDTATQSDWIVSLRGQQIVTTV
jgi:prolipoprotein diacylglyceryltransferase